jgi:hypothetical protein
MIEKNRRRRRKKKRYFLRHKPKTNIQRASTRKSL